MVVQVQTAELRFDVIYEGVARDGLLDNELQVRSRDVRVYSTKTAESILETNRGSLILQVNSLGFNITCVIRGDINESSDGEIAVVLVSLDPPENAVRGLHAREFLHPEKEVVVQLHGEEEVSMNGSS